jgi:hypothetical protein
MPASGERRSDGADALGGPLQPATNPAPTWRDFGHVPNCRRRRRGVLLVPPPRPHVDARPHPRTSRFLLPDREGAIARLRSCKDPTCPSCYQAFEYTFPLVGSGWFAQLRRSPSATQAASVRKSGSVANAYGCDSLGGLPPDPRTRGKPPRQLRCLHPRLPPEASSIARASAVACSR